MDDFRSEAGVVRVSMLDSVPYCPLQLNFIPNRESHAEDPGRARVFAVCRRGMSSVVILKVAPPQGAEPTEEELFPAEVFLLVDQVLVVRGVYFR